MCNPVSIPPDWLVAGIAAVAATMPSVATVERHDEAVTPFARQLGWTPAIDDDSLVRTDALFVKHGYLPPPEAIAHVRALGVDRVLVCGIQADTCVLAAGFSLFDNGLTPCLLGWLTMGSSLDRSGQLGIDMWRHHFGAVLTGPDQL